MGSGGRLLGKGELDPGRQEVEALHRARQWHDRSEYLCAINVTDKRTALFDIHKRMGARLIPFGGWSMPVEYSGIAKEHTAVRTAAGLFDVTHMGEFEVTGPQALRLLQYVTCNDVSCLSDGQAQYSVFTTPEGTAVDDLLVYRLAHD